MAILRDDELFFSFGKSSLPFISSITMPRMSFPADKLYSVFLADHERPNLFFLDFIPLTSGLEGPREGTDAVSEGPSLESKAEDGVDECLR